MDTIIQIIKTEWTKKSRGCPGAAARNSVPNHFPLSISSVGGVSLQKVTYFESNDFKKSHTKTVNAICENKLREIRIALHKESNALKVMFWGTPIRAAYGKAKTIALLSPNSWLQIIGNVRIPYEYTTGYNKYVYNIFYGELKRVNEIVNYSEPVKIYNEEVNLY